MRHFLFAIIGGIVVLTISSGLGMAGTDAEYASASQLMPSCRAFIKDVDEELGTNGVSRFGMGRCVGVIEGLRFADAGLCVPRHASHGQVIRVVVKYVDDQPSRLHEISGHSPLKLFAPLGVARNRFMEICRAIG
jgi:hypothetical protein